MNNLENVTFHYNERKETYNAKHDGKVIASGLEIHSSVWKIAFNGEAFTHYENDNNQIILAHTKDAQETGLCFLFDIDSLMSYDDFVFITETGHDNDPLQCMLKFLDQIKR